jgi:antitoxin component of MazEF toxin-antitoxin module
MDIKHGEAMAGIETKARKLGKNIVVPIPPAIAQHLGIRVGTPILVRELNAKVVVSRLARRRRRLSEILRSCRRKFPAGNPHGQIDFGPAVGNERW